MPALANLVAGAEGSEAAGVEIIGTRAGARVPGLARVILLEAGPRVYRISPIRTESLRRLTLLSCVRFGPEQTQQAAIDIGMRNLKRPATHQIAQQIDKVILDPARYNAKPPS